MLIDLNIAIAREAHEFILQPPNAFPNLLEVEEEGSYGEYDAEVEGETENRVSLIVGEDPIHDGGGVYKIYVQRLLQGVKHDSYEFEGCDEDRTRD